MVAAIRCPNAKCRKFMLVEDQDHGKIVPCLICKQPIKVPLAASSPGASATSVPPTTAPVAMPAPPTDGNDLTPIFDDDEPQFRME